jgi:hypothetical protein
MQTTHIAAFRQAEDAFIQEGACAFTPSQALFVVENLRYDRQRDERRAKQHICTLAEYMRRDQWLSKSQIDFARLDGRLILLNGHHRMRAQVMADRDILWNVAIHDCASMEEVRALFYRFDTTVRARTGSNIMEGVGFGEELGLGRDAAAKLWAASILIGNGLTTKRGASYEGRKLLNDELLTICREYSKEAALYFKITRSAPRQVRIKLRSASCFAVAVVTLKAMPEVAQPFWEGLCKDDGLRRGDPRKALLLDLVTRAGNRGLANSTLVTVAKAWNAFALGRDLKIIKVTGHAVQVHGTSFRIPG